MGMSMSRIVYVNGEYLPEADAKISVFDRGFLMADAVYEVTSVIDGKILAFDGHTERLERSLRELDMKAPCTIPELLDIHRELIKRNDLTEGLVYLQGTRGIADRDFAYPDVEPSLVLFTQTKNVVNSPMAKTGMKVISIPDIRWGRRDIKTVQLLAPSMGKMAAKAAGCDDAWLVEDGFVTEGTSNNAYIVQQDGTIVTRNLGTEILAGITRAAVLRFASEAQIKIEERPFTIEEDMQAKEAFVTSATTFVGPVVEIDGAKIGDGKVGDIARRLREIYLEESLKTAI
jgi:D-alanine transaminase